MFGRLTRGSLAAPLFCIAAVAANQSVFRVGDLPLVVAASLVVAVAAIALMAPDVSTGAPPREPLRWFNAVLGAVIVAPLIVTFAFGINRDFPFSGDHYFHVGQAYRIAFWWLSPPASAVVHVPTLDDVAALLRHPAGLLLSRAALTTAIVAITALVYRRQRCAALGVATIAVVGWGLCEQTIFVRYPAGGYMLVMPFLGPAFLLHNIELAGRVANVLAPLVWLFALRPWLIGRWPDVRVLAFAVAMFWQQDVIYYFDTVYMEPWAVVLCLLAIELLIDRGEEGAPLACLLIGAAATVKEPVIFALPLVWLAGAPWRSASSAVRLTGCAFAAGVPFVLYFLARNSVAEDPAEISRGLHFGLPPGPILPYAQEYVHRLAASFTSASGVLFLVALVLLAVLIVRVPGRRLAIACVGSAGLVLVAFFLAERDSLAWVGYFRFLLLALPFLAAGLLAAAGAVAPRWAAALGIAALLLQTSSAAVAIARAAGPIAGLNFVENYDAPLFFPMKSLIAEARAKGLIATDATIYANAPDTSLRAIPGIPVTYAPVGEPVCECTPQHPAVMLLSIRYANLAAGFSRPDGPASFGPPPDRSPLWRAAADARPACLTRLRSSCAHVLERVEGGEPVAVLGTSR